MNTGQKITWAITTRVALLLLLLSGGAAEADHSNRPAGTVVVWGSNFHGQTNVPAGLTDIAAIAAGAFHSVALRKDGTVVAWGDNSQGACTVPEGLSDVVSIFAATWSSYALKSDGTVVGWGLNYGMETIPEGLSDVIDLAINPGALHALALKSDGTVVLWGYSTVSEDWWGDERDVRAIKAVPPDLGDVVAVSVGGRHSLALKGDGTVVAWGDNGGAVGSVQWFGQTSVPFGLTDVIAIDAGENHSLALRGDGTVVAWGESWFNGVSYNQSVVPSDLRDIVAIAAFALNSIALSSDGTVVAWGDDELGLSTTAPGSIGATAIAAGANHALALKGDGTVVAWGGSPGAVKSIVPEGLRDVVAIAAGSNHSLALVVDQTPRLEAQHSENHLRLAWPEPASDYRLEVTEDLSDPSSWVVEPTVPTLVDSEYVVTLEPPSGNRFYRLTRE